MDVSGCLCMFMDVSGCLCMFMDVCGCFWMLKDQHLDFTALNRQKWRMSRVLGVTVADTLALGESMEKTQKKGGCNMMQPTKTGIHQHHIGIIGDFGLILDRGFFSECQHPSGEFPVIEKNRNSPSQ